LLEKAGFKGRMPRLSACGGRTSVFDDFETAFTRQKAGDYIAMLVDSEDPVKDLEKTWDHLKQRDKRERPSGAVDEQILFMTTCMETWIVADQAALISHYGSDLQKNALPALDNLEKLGRHGLHDNLVQRMKAASAWSSWPSAERALAWLKRCTGELGSIATAFTSAPSALSYSCNFIARCRGWSSRPRSCRLPSCPSFLSPGQARVRPLQAGRAWRTPPLC
jgi:hypothetical protein